MKPSLVRRVPSLALLVLALALVLLVPPAPAATSDAPAAAKPAATSKAEADKPSSAERRAADSEFEREKLDQSAFEESKPGAKDEPAAKQGGGGSIVRALVGLVVVLGAIFGVHWLLKKWGGSRMQGAAGRSGIIDVVATTTLAQGRALHVVRVGEELVLVGATEQSITRIGEVDAGVLSGTAGDRGNGEFQAMLSGAMYGQQPGVPNGMGGAGSTRPTFLQRFLDNLRMSTAR